MSNVSSSSLPVFALDAKPNSNITRHTATFHPTIWGDYFLSYDPSSAYEQERGHVVSSLDCYMKQHNTSRQDTIEELLKLVESAWKDINAACLNPTQVPMKFLMRVVNLARMMDVLYKDEDSYTNAGGIMKDYIKILLVNKIFD
ncbi:hypothetical protein GLYMA_U032900v4 [Glycine max]|uniref:Terpene synthase metal-binding domain-containing protein n=1 Tax=Glycine max TaxID=3847 RepID=K7KBU8_SOYBN|nr:hypothetical protein GLYMA_U032900v4 [Glycine max]